MLPLAVIAFGCEPEKRMEEAPPAEQKTVMVPSWREGQPAPTPAPATQTPAGQEKAPAPLPPGSRPDGPQPGDLDYKGN